MRAVSLLLIVTLLAASLPLGASTMKRACCKSKTACPMKQHHTNGCAIRCGVSAPAPRAVAAIRDVPAIPLTVELPLPATMSVRFETPRAIAIRFVSPPPTPPPL